MTQYQKYDKLQSEAINRSWTDNTMVKRINGTTMVDKKIKAKQHENYLKPG